MRVTIISILLLTACADGNGDTSLIKETDVSLTIPVPSEYARRDVKQCTVVKTTQIRDCTLYELKCHDLSDELVMLCEIQPFSPELSDPPRPPTPTE